MAGSRHQTVAESDEPWRQPILERRRAERDAGAPMFLGIPDRWYEDPHWRCRNGHVSIRYLKSEERGDLCLACLTPVMMTFPEDDEADA